VEVEVEVEVEMKWSWKLDVMTITSLWQLLELCTSSSLLSCEVIAIDGLCNVSLRNCKWMETYFSASIRTRFSHIATLIPILVPSDTSWYIGLQVTNTQSLNLPVYSDMVKLGIIECEN
jgi:hypothetical protein